MSGAIPNYELYALRYATMHDRAASDLYYRWAAYGLEDYKVDMACYFWVIRSPEAVVLVDSGWNRERGLSGGTNGRYDRIKVTERDPLELLAELNIAPEAVDHILVTHMHIDHIGNLDLFPRARVTVSRAEFELWTSPHGREPALAHAVNAKDVDGLAALARAGRVAFVDGVQEVLPGITATVVGGHSPGQTILEVETLQGTVVLASDAVHYHNELQQARPFYIFTDLVAMFDAYDLLRERAARPGTWVVSGHDPVEMDRFTRVGSDCVDLTQPQR